MYKTSIEIGITPDDFWGYTIFEVTDVISAKIKKENNEVKFKLRLAETLSEMIFQRVSILVSDKTPKPQTLFEMFPHLFSKEELEQIKEKEKQAQLDAYKTKFMNFSYRHNASRKGDKQ